MIEQTAWFERKFASIADNGLFPDILERLEGTTLRLSHKVKDLEEAILNFKPANKWSIKEEIGHLLDLEPLWYGRIHDIKMDMEELRHADLSNTKTHEAEHNKNSVGNLIGSFKQEREKLTQLLYAITDADLLKSALHPRLKTPMRVIDLCYFVAEHDDHHLARISNIIRNS